MRGRAPHPLPQNALRELDDVVAALRPLDPCRLNVAETASALGVRITYRDLGRTLLGLALDDSRVLLHQELRGARRTLVFAHELAHVYRRRGRFGGIAPTDEEWFADWFARELVLPRRWLSNRWPRTHLGSIHVDIETVALQMAATDRAPALMRNGRRVLCRACGTDLHDLHCACRFWRRGQQDLRALPDVHHLDLLCTPACPRDAWLSMSDLPAAPVIAAAA